MIWRIELILFSVYGKIRPQLGAFNMFPQGPQTWKTTICYTEPALWLNLFHILQTDMFISLIKLFPLPARISEHYDQVHWRLDKRPHGVLNSVFSLCAQRAQCFCLHLSLRNISVFAINLVKLTFHSREPSYLVLSG